MSNSSWDTAKKSDISELSTSDIKQVSGGNPIFVVIAIAAFSLGYDIGRDHRDR